MRLSRFAAAFVVLPVTLQPVACGAPANRELQSITVSPSTANPHAVNGNIQFTATGHWSASPMIVTPQTASWGACQNQAATSAVTVTSAGLASCTGTASGTYTVFAYDPINCNAITACGGGCTISGAAQLTCP